MYRYKEFRVHGVGITLQVRPEGVSAGVNLMERNPRVVPEVRQFPALRVVFLFKVSAPLRIYEAALWRIKRFQQKIDATVLTK